MTSVPLIQLVQLMQFVLIITEDLLVLAVMDTNIFIISVLVRCFILKVLRVYSYVLISLSGDYVNFKQFNFVYNFFQLKLLNESHI